METIEALEITDGRMRNLPDYDDPPVIETVLGVQFAPLEKWQIPHFGLFWLRIKDDYPHFEAAPELTIAVESPQLEFKQNPPSVEIVTAPQARIWFLNEAKTELIQLQRDCLMHNWRKVSGIGLYPHYENIRPRFERDWGLFFQFLGSQALGTPDVRQCEVTYVNHIDRGEAWESFADLPSVFPCWTGTSSENFLPSPESVSFNISYTLPENRGRLHITMTHAFRTTDARETLQLTLTARGKPASSALSDLLEWLDFGRHWVVRGFTDFTSGRMHDLWGRTE